MFDLQKFVEYIELHMYFVSEFISGWILDTLMNLIVICDTRQIASDDKRKLVIAILLHQFPKQVFYDMINRDDPDYYDIKYLVLGLPNPADSYLDTLSGYLIASEPLCTENYANVSKELFLKLIKSNFDEFEKMVKL